MFSRSWHQLHFFALSLDWYMYIAMCGYAVIGHMVLVMKRLQIHTLLNVDSLLWLEIKSVMMCHVSCMSQWMRYMCLLEWCYHVHY